MPKKKKMSKKNKTKQKKMSDSNSGIFSKLYYQITCLFP